MNRGIGAKKKTRREKLLAMVHIAVKELGIPEGDYRGILEREFGKRSARDLSELELGYLVDYFQEKGWKAQSAKSIAHGAKGKGHSAKDKQIVTLRARAREIASGIENGKRRLAGLVRKMCGVDRLEWCREAACLKRLLAALEGIRRSQASRD